jgi:hypothetical protein
MKKTYNNIKRDEFKKQVLTNIYGLKKLTARPYKHNLTAFISLIYNKDCCFKIIPDDYLYHQVELGNTLDFITHECVKLREYFESIEDIQYTMPNKYGNTFIHYANTRLYRALDTGNIPAYEWIMIEPLINHVAFLLKLIDNNKIITRGE